MKLTEETYKLLIDLLEKKHEKTTSDKMKQKIADALDELDAIGTY